MAISALADVSLPDGIRPPDGSLPDGVRPHSARKPARARCLYVTYVPPTQTACPVLEPSTNGKPDT